MVNIESIDVERFQVLLQILRLLLCHMKEIRFNQL